MFDQEKTGLAAGLLVDARIVGKKRRTLGHARQLTRGGKSFLLLPLEGEEYVKVSSADWRPVAYSKLEPTQQSAFVERQKTLWHHGVIIEYGTVVRRIEDARCGVVIAHVKNGSALEVFTSLVEERLMEEWHIEEVEVISFSRLGLVGSAWVSYLYSLDHRQRTELAQRARTYSQIRD